MKVVHAGGERFAAEEIVVGVGRRPNLEGLGLEEAGVGRTSAGSSSTTRCARSLDGVYAAGDVAGRWLFTHAAGYEGVRAVRNMFFPGRSKGDYGVPWCTFTDPELAHAGLTAAQARERFGEDDVEVHRHELSHSDRARADGATTGSSSSSRTRARSSARTCCASARASSSTSSPWPSTRASSSRTWAR